MNGIITRFRAVTFNIRHGRGMDNRVSLQRVAQELGEAAPDVIGLQEVDRFMPRSGFRDQFRHLEQLLQCEGRFSPSLRIGPCQYGNAIFTPHPIVHQEIYRLKGTLEARSIIAVQLQVSPDDLVTVVNTHLGLTEKEKRSQMARLTDIVSEFDGTVVVMGDFNMVTGSEHFTRFTQLWKKAEQSEVVPTARNGREIDHVFINEPDAYSEAKVQVTTASDHHPVIAELAWSRPLIKVG